MENIRFDRTLDMRGISCPLPILNTRKSVESLTPGEVLRILTTDHGSIRFFESLVRQTGLELVSWQAQNNEYQFFIRTPEEKTS